MGMLTAREDSDGLQLTRKRSAAKPQPRQMNHGDTETQSEHLHELHRRPGLRCPDVSLLCVRRASVVQMKPPHEAQAEPERTASTRPNRRHDWGMRRAGDAGIPGPAVRRSGNPLSPSRVSWNHKQSRAWHRRGSALDEARGRRWPHADVGTEGARRFARRAGEIPSPGGEGKGEGERASRFLPRTILPEILRIHLCPAARNDGKRTWLALTPALSPRRGSTASSVGPIGVQRPSTAFASASSVPQRPRTAALPNLPGHCLGV